MAAIRLIALALLALWAAPAWAGNCGWGYYLSWPLDGQSRYDFEDHDPDNANGKDQISAYLRCVVAEEKAKIAAADLVDVTTLAEYDPAAIEVAIEAAFQRGKWAYVPEGDYEVSSPITVPPGGRFIAEHLARFYHAAEGGGGVAAGQAMLESTFPDPLPCPMACGDTPQTGTNDVVVVGGTWLNKDKTSGNRRRGRTILWYGNNWRVRGVLINTFGTDPAVASAGAIAMSWVGDASEVSDIVFRNPYPSKGRACMRWQGGSGAVVRRIDGMCGDDGFAAGPSCRDNDDFNCTFSEIDIRGVDVADMRIYSTHARIFVAGLGRVPGQAGIRSTIRGVKFRRIFGVTRGFSAGDFASAVFNAGEGYDRAVTDVYVSDIRVGSAPGYQVKFGWKSDYVGLDHQPLRISNFRFVGTYRTGGKAVNCLRGALVLDGVRQPCP